MSLGRLLTSVDQCLKVQIDGSYGGKTSVTVVRKGVETSCRVLSDHKGVNT